MNLNPSLCHNNYNNMSAHQCSENTKRQKFILAHYLKKEKYFCNFKS